MNKVGLDTFKNDWYKPANKIKLCLWYFVNILFIMNPLNPFSSLKVVILRLFGSKIGRGVLIKPAVNIKYPWLLEIGDYVWIGEKVWIDNLGTVTIGDSVCISQGAMILCGNHNYKKSSFDLIIGNVIIEEGSWVGAHSIVCPGIKMASHSILAVNSVLTKNSDEYGVYQGNPAELVRKRIID